MLIEMFCPCCFHQHHVTISCEDFGSINHPNIIRNIAHLDPRDCIKNLKNKISELITVVNAAQTQIMNINKFIHNQKDLYLETYTPMVVVDMYLPYGLETGRAP